MSPTPEVNDQIRLRNGEHSRDVVVTPNVGREPGHGVPFRRRQNGRSARRMLSETGEPHRIPAGQELASEPLTDEAAPAGYNDPT